jgi:diguanylate cyclase (GGDEF)-like protein
MLTHRKHGSKRPGPALALVSRSTASETDVIALETDSHDLPTSNPDPTLDVRAHALAQLRRSFEGTSWVLVERAGPRHHEALVCGYVGEEDVRDVARALGAETGLLIRAATPGALRYAEPPRVRTWPSRAPEPDVALAVFADPGGVGPTEAELTLATQLLASVASGARAVDELRRKASVDAQTGVATRAAVLELADRERERACRYGRNLAVAFVDIDGLKTVNDAYGHGAGDQLILTVARALSAELRGTDSIGRLGGDEFLLVLPETDLEGARRLVSRLRSRLASVRLHLGTTVVRPSASFGFAALGEGLADDIIDLADRRMLEDKRRRRKGRACELEAERPATSIHLEPSFGLANG